MQWRNPLISIGLALSLLLGLAAFVAPISSQEAPLAGEGSAAQDDPAPTVSAEAALQDEGPCLRLETLLPAPVPLPAAEPVGLAQETVQAAVGSTPVPVELPCAPEQVRALVDETEETVRQVVDLLVCDHEDECVTISELLELIVAWAQAEVEEAVGEAERHLPEGTKPVQTPTSSEEAAQVPVEVSAELPEELPAAVPVDPPADVPTTSPSDDPDPVRKKVQAAAPVGSDVGGALLS